MLKRSRIYLFRGRTFDAGTGDLTWKGRKIRVPEQTIRLLVLLLERPGGMVSRDELRKHLWPDREFSQYEQGINNAVSRLRTILQEDSENPKLLETIPKRGYRFLAEVEIVEPEDKNETGLAIQQSATLSAHRQDAASSAPLAIPSHPAPSFFPSRMQWPVRRRWIASLGIVLIVLAAFAVRLHYRQAPPNSDVIELGIVPFDTDGDGAAELGESFRLDLMDAMSEFPLVQVRAAQSLNDLKEDDASVLALSRKVNLTVLLFGHLKLRGENCQIEIELVRTSDAVHLASLQYRGTKAELASIRESIQRDIYEQLRMARQPVQQMRGSTANAHAYEMYLRARYHLSQRTDDSTQRALDEFGAAIKDDPHFERAYAGMATAHLIRADYSFSPAKESYRNAEEFANAALRNGVPLAEAHGALGYVSFRYDWNTALAESELRQAIELEPGRAIYHVWYAVLLSDVGRFDESFQQIALAHASDPLWAPIYGAETLLACNARDHARELAAAKKLVELKPNWPASHDDMAWAFWHSKQYVDAISEWKRMAVLEGDVSREGLEDKGLEAFRRGGMRAYAQIRLAAAKSGLDNGQHSNDFVPAEWYAYSGEREKAIAELENMVSRHDPDALLIAVNPAYEDLHTAPRFQSLSQRVAPTHRQ
jgi:DNA-binding winged helix-turn-helix (wHTH) protein/Tfp pilus assembly protein PilF/TolB-like protein